MTTTRLTLTHLLAGALVLGASGIRPVATACSMAVPLTPTRILGLDEYNTIDETRVLPANAAGIGDLGGETFMSAGIELTRLPEGTAEYEMVGSGEARLTVLVGTTPDLTPPELLAVDSAVLAAGGGCGGCVYGGSTLTTVQLEVRASDDIAVAATLSFALYFGNTEAEAVAASSAEGPPDAWVMADEIGTVWTYVDETASFVVVRVFDQAGNASAASDPVRMTRG